MPPVLASIAGTIYGVTGITVTAAGMASAALQAALLVGGAVYANVKRKKAQAAANAAIEDNKYITRASAAPMQIVVGRARVPGVQIACGWAWSNANKNLTIPVAFAGHEVSSIDDVWFNTETIGVLDAYGYVQAGSKWYKARDEARVVTVSGGAVNSYVSLPGGANGRSIMSVAYEINVTDWSSYQVVNLQQGTDYSVDTDGSSNLRIKWLVDTSAQSEITVTYVLATGEAFARAIKFLGTSAGWRDTELETTSGGEWTATDIGKNITRIHFTFVWDQDMYPNGVPNPTAIINGAKVYDPRLDSTNGGSGAHRFATPATWEWSENPALIWAWYMTASIGMGCTSAEINWPSVITAANVCDEWIPTDAAKTITAITKANPAVVTSTAHGYASGDIVLISATGMTQVNGNRYIVTKVNDNSYQLVGCNSTSYGNFTSGNGITQQKQFTCNGVMSTGDDHRTNIDKILSSMVGIRFFSGGQFYVKAASYVTPALDLDQGAGADLGDNDFAAGGIKILPRTKRRDLFNSVRGTYLDSHASSTFYASDPGGLYALTDFPSYSSATYVSLDNGEYLWEDIELPLTLDWRRAQRIAKLILFRSRQALTIACQMKVKAYRLQPGDTFTLTSAYNGWSSKVFRVLDRQYEPHGDIMLIAQEEASSVYSWSYDEATDPDPAPNTNLPDPRLVNQLTGISVNSTADDYYVLPDGRIVAYVDITWTGVTDSAVLSGGRIEIWWKRAVETEWQKSECSPSSTRYRLEPVSASDVITAYLWVYNGSQVKSQASFIVVNLHDQLPSNQNVLPVGDNALTNPSFQYGVDGWSSYDTGAKPAGCTHVFTKELGYEIGGCPANAALIIYDPAAGSGNNYLVAVQSQLIPVQPGSTVAAFADLVAWNTDTYVAVGYYSSQDAYLYTAKGNVLAGAPWATTNPGVLSTYRRSKFLAIVPPGVYYARLVFAAAGNWLAGTEKRVYIMRPFLGQVPYGSLDVPTWSAGGSPVLGTEGLASGAATQMFYNTDTIGGGVANWTVQGTSVNILCVGPQINALSSGTVEVSVTFTLGASHVPVTGDPARRIVAYLGRFVGDNPPKGVSSPVMMATTAEPYVASYTRTATFNYTVGETIQPFIAITRETLATQPKVAENVISPSTGTNNTTDRVYGAVWRCTLVKR